MKILVFGDERGLPVLTQKIPHENLAGIVCASIRPNCIEMLRDLAAEQKLPFLIHPKPRDPDYPQFVKTIQEIKPDLIWVYSYSMILREDILSIPPQGAINIHGALLPQYRGANPTQWAILNGEFETGSTLHVMTSGIDEGPIIDQQKIPLYFEDTWKNVFERNDKGAQLLIDNNIASILKGEWESKKQNESKAGYCRRRTQRDGLFLWKQPVYQIYNLIRALVKPLPGAFYINKQGDQIVIDEYLSIQNVIRRKYGEDGGEKIANEYFHFSSEVNAIDYISNKVELNEALIQLSDIAFLINLDDCGNTIGFCSLTNIDWKNCEAALQIHLNTCENKSKFSSLVIQALHEFALRELNLNKVHVQLTANPDLTREVLEENGFIANDLSGEYFIK